MVTDDIIVTIVKHIQEYLEQLGLTDIEAKCYLKLLETGPISVKDLAEAVGLKRTTAYLYIDPLVEKGLAAKVVIDSQKQIAPTDIANLEHLLKEKITATKKLEEEFPKILGEITTKLSSAKEIEDFEIKYYKSMSGIQKIYEEALQTDELRSYVKLVELGDVFKNNVALFNKAFEKNPQLKIREIFYESPVSKKEAQEIALKNKRYSYKFMPKDMKLVSEDILIYKGKVAIVHYRKNNISSVVLKNKAYYNNAKELFDFIWKVIPDKIIDQQQL